MPLQKKKNTWEERPTNTLLGMELCVRGFLLSKKGNWFHFWYLWLTHYRHQAELFDSKVWTNLLDIILTKMEKVFLILPKVSSWTTKIKHVDDNVGSLKVKLTAEDFKEITDTVSINEVAGARIHAGIELYSWRFVNTPSKSDNASEQDS
ncbi:hypothetical protein CMV_022805 [Castanea mollissima]|uniref:Uncharacterized protein n=1 Tax=Castanea mollissima TaxID=60419 RepID=A0A8J4QIU9_9ROSI|nr:hypothetical protein CMV_022805 [Castanea mollissima]